MYICISCRADVFPIIILIGVGVYMYSRKYIDEMFQVGNTSENMKRAVQFSQGFGGPPLKRSL